MKKTNDPKRIAREGMIASIAIEKGKKAGLTPFQAGLILMHTAADFGLVIYLT